MSKLIILQTVVPDYRKKIFSYIRKQLENDFLLFCGDFYFEESIKSDSSINYTNKVKNHFFFNRKLLFQTGMWSHVVKKNIMILELNPRIISNWIILILRKILRKRTILWGHAWPRKGQQSKSDIVRNWMRNIADVVVVYTKTQAKELKIKMPGKTVLFAPNAVISSKEMKASNNSGLIKNIIYVGRLTEIKKPMLLVKAFHNILDKLPKDTKLIIVGEGKERNKIEIFINKSNLKDKVIFEGHLLEYERLKLLYNSSLVSISPGYVGLSITQSFGFGVPMLISQFENHSPELEAAIENKNSLFFKTDNMEDFGNKILLFFQEKEYWIGKRREICEHCKSNYSVELMARTFINIYKR